MDEPSAVRMERHLRILRESEIEQIRSWFKPDTFVLEIGSGSGFQASALSTYGCKVFCIDLPKRSSVPKNYFPVGEYDGKNIPFKSDAFNVVFTSNVLEHIRDLRPVFKEIKRVLKSDGIAIHVLPSASWRFWTSVVHYIYLPQYILRRLVKHSICFNPSEFRSAPSRYHWWYLMKRALIPGPHGEHANAFLELFYFSKILWLRLFNRNGFDVLDIQKNNLFYTGYGLFLNLSLPIRRKLALILGSSCHIFITRCAPINKS